MENLNEYNENFNKTYRLGKFLMLGAFAAFWILIYILNNLVIWKLK